MKRVFISASLILLSSTLTALSQTVTEGDNDERTVETSIIKEQKKNGFLFVNQSEYRKLPVSVGGVEYHGNSGIRADGFVLATGSNAGDSLWVKSADLHMDVISKDKLIQTTGEMRQGVAQRLAKSTLWTQTTTRTIKGMTLDSWISEQWTTVFDVDIPSSPTFEQQLCKLLFKNSKKRLEQAGMEFSKKFRGKRIDNKNTNRVTIRGHANLVTVSGHALSYSPGKYYSYVYSFKYGHKQKIDAFPQDALPLGTPEFKNIIFNLQTQKVLKLADVLTVEEIKRIGLKKSAKVDLAMDSHFLYVGLKGKPVQTYALSQENWNKFAPALQSLIGPYDELTAKNDTTDFVMSSYEGIQPAIVSLKVIQNLSHKWNNDSLMDYLKKQVKIPTGMKEEEEYQIQFVIEKDGHVTNVEANNQMDINKSLYLQLAKAFENMPAWQPLILAKVGAQRTLMTYDIKFIPFSEGGRFVSDEKVFSVVEQMPEFPGGQAAFLKWLSDNIKYPAIAEENGIQGRVICTFVVERNGSITDVQVVRSIDPSLDKEAVRVLKIMPKWIPGRANGKTVRVKYTVPVTFRLQ